MSRGRDALDDKLSLERGDSHLAHKIPKDPRRSRINATPKKGSTGTREPIDNVRTSSPLPPFFHSLSLSFSLHLSIFLQRPPKITRVWLAPVASMTKVGWGPERDTRARAGGCHVRIYISDFLFMQLFVREPRERVSRAS